MNFASNTILLGEAWGQFFGELDDGQELFYTEEVIGRNAQPGQRFGGGEGVPPGQLFFDGVTNNVFASNSVFSPELPYEAAEDGEPWSSLPYYRHPGRLDDPAAIDGRTHVAAADGSANAYRPSELFEEPDGGQVEAVSTLKLLWGPEDFDIVRANRGD